LGVVIAQARLLPVAVVIAGGGHSPIAVTLKERAKERGAIGHVENGVDGQID
jgi:predicted ThiF/HesA family dinucleotide-utilizing enzyme